MTYESDEDVMDSAALRAAKDVMEYGDTERGEGELMGERSERSQRRRYVVTAEESGIDLSYHAGRIVFYSPPRQRQRWGETQSLPHVSWGDLFFDLFYVAATYNVSYILTESPNREGLLYAAGTFLPVQAFWMQQVYLNARLVYDQQAILPFLFQVAVLAILATAVVNIRPVYYMSNASGDLSMFYFTLMIVLWSLLSLVMWLEVYFFSVGQRPQLKNTATTSIKFLMCGLAFYVAALAVAAKEYYGDGGDDRRFLAAKDSSYDVNSTAGEYESTKDGDYGESSYSTGYGYSSNTNLPIWLVLGGHVSYTVVLAINVIFFFPSGGLHKELTIPLNIDFVMHRNGEWTMLMLGESIFSILIVNVPDESSDFFVTFYCAILTVVFLYHLHFQSQPHNPDCHAMRRDKNAGIMWGVVQQVYSLALVSLGAAFTFFLEYFGSREDHRRWLAATTATSIGEDLATGNTMFCLSLAVIFLCLDVMSLLHLGMKESRGRCVCTRSNKFRIKVAMLPILRAGIIVFTATLYKWESEPKNLAIIGLLIVLTQLFIRRVGAKYASHKQVHSDH